MTDVTIITPFFNTQDYLHRCVSSVLGQKGIALRLILVDDGSTDNSNRIALNYANNDNRVELIVQENSGQGPARNRALEQVDSEFVYFVDSDDSLGQGTLQKLVSASRTYELDLCSPGVPRKYFDKRLELVPCLPCKSQFMRFSLIRDRNITQPDARSGQDGVFSHLFLTGAERIGCVEKAVFNYTSGRPGSTFAKYKSLHAMVPALIETHLNFIEDYYDQNDLWSTNSDRLLMFIAEETLRNRYLPHRDSLSKDQIDECRKIIGGVFDKITPNLKVFDVRKDAFLNEFRRFLAGEDTNVEQVPDVANLPNNNLYKDGVKIVKYWNEGLSATKKIKRSTTDSVKAQRSKEDLVLLESKLDKALKKIDFLINTVNNNSYLIASCLTDSLQALNDNEGPIVSLTTLPERLGSLDVVLVSIFKQTIRPSKIVVWITDQLSRKDLDARLLVFENLGVEFRFVEDIGPHTKLIYSLREFPDKNIVTVDDDIVYPPNMLKSLLDANSFAPDAICANWARELAFDSKGSVLGVRSGKLLTPPLLEDDIEQAEKFQHKRYKLGFPYGTSGVLYPPGCFDSIVFDEDLFKNLCPKEDDIWFRACSLVKGTDVVVTNLGINPKHHCVAGSQDIALRHHNHGEGGNVDQMQNVFDSLGLYKVIKQE